MISCDGAHLVPPILGGGSGVAPKSSLETPAGHPRPAADLLGRYRGLVAAFY
jgi:hypothetical protein